MSAATAMQKNKGLGKGISALFSDGAEDEVELDVKGKVLQVQPSNLQPNKYQPRQVFNDEGLSELKDSIMAHGIMQPIIVRETSESGKYEIIAGERRWRAATQIGLSSVPVIIRDYNNNQALELALIENIQRQDLSPIEEAVAYQRLADEFSYTQEAISKSVGKSRSHVANLMRLLNLPQDVKDMINQGKISMGHARALLVSSNPSALAHKIIAESLNVRETEALTKRPANETTATERPISNAGKVKNDNSDVDDFRPTNEIEALEKAATESLGLQVKINAKGNRGEVVISYANLRELDMLLRVLG